MRVGKSECSTCGKHFKRDELSTRGWCPGCERDFDEFMQRRKGCCALSHCVAPDECRLQQRCIERTP